MCQRIVVPKAGVNGLSRERYTLGLDIYIAGSAWDDGDLRAETSERRWREVQKHLQFQNHLRANSSSHHRGPSSDRHSGKV